MRDGGRSLDRRQSSTLQIMRKSITLVALLSLAAACSSTPPVDAERESEPVPAPVPAPAPAAAPAPAPDEVQHLAAYPAAGSYEDLGVVQFTFFRPGIVTPSLRAVMDELKSKVRGAGGNAFV